MRISIRDLENFVVNLQKKNLHERSLRIPSRVLIVNDDGPESPYTFPLADLLRKSGAEVYTVVPYLERSACSHSVSVYSPVRLHRRDEFTYMPEGTPVDCVKIAVKYLFPDIKFDAVISGPNSGYNLGRNIIYSGTVGAALEATFWGYLSFAVSFPSFSRLDNFRRNVSDEDFMDYSEVVEKLTGFLPVVYAVAELVRDSEPGLGFFVNVNFPPEFFLRSRPLEAFDVFFSRPGKAWFREWYDIREDPQGRKFLWLTGEEVEDFSQGVDSWAVSQGMISVSLLGENYSHIDIKEFVPELAEWVLEENLDGD